MVATSRFRACEVDGWAGVVRWLGRVESSNEHLLLEVSTWEVLKARSVKSRPESEQFHLGDQFLLRATATPWIFPTQQAESGGVVVPVSVPVL